MDKIKMSISRRGEIFRSKKPDRTAGNVGRDLFKSFEAAQSRPRPGTEIDAYRLIQSGSQQLLEQAEQAKRMIANAQASMSELAKYGNKLLEMHLARLRG